MAVEKLAGIEVPQRANYIRVMMAELTRILNHAAAVGFLINDMGAWQTPLAYGMREREKILDLFEMASGARMMCNYFRFGGVVRDLPPEFMPPLQDLMRGCRPSSMSSSGCCARTRSCCCAPRASAFCRKSWRHRTA